MSSKKSKSKQKGGGKPVKSSKPAKGDKSSKAKKPAKKTAKQDKASKKTAAAAGAATKVTKSSVKDASTPTPTPAPAKAAPTTEEITATKQDKSGKDEKRGSQFLLPRPSLTNEESKLMVINYSTVTLDTWLEDNNYFYLKEALNAEMGVSVLDDIKAISERDLNGMFESLAKKRATVLNKLTMKAEIRFKRKFITFVNGYNDHISNNKKDNKNKTQNKSKNNNKDNNNKDSNSKNNTNTPNAKLTVDYQTGMDFIKLFKANSMKLNTQYQSGKDSIYMDYDRAMTGIKDQRDKLLIDLKDDFEQRSELLSSQLMLVKKYLQNIETCEKECNKQPKTPKATKAPKTPKASKKGKTAKKSQTEDKNSSNSSNSSNKAAVNMVSDCLKGRPELFEIPFDIELEKVDLKTVEENYENLFSKIVVSSIDKSKLGRQTWDASSSTESKEDEDVEDEKGNWRENLQIGSKVDAYEKVDKKSKQWHSATVVTVVSLSNGTQRVEVNFDGLSEDYEAFINRDSKNLAKHGTHTASQVSIKDLQKGDDMGDD